jgi:lysophospholipase L1-like esterase
MLRRMKSIVRLWLAALWLGVPMQNAWCAETNHNFVRWEGEISAYEKMDATNPPPAGVFVFTGSSTIGRWKTLAQDFPGSPVLNRGFGGSEIVDATHFADRIIFPYAPSKIFLRAGGNDLWAGKSPEEVFADFQEFVARVHARLPASEIIFISLSPSLARWSQHDSEKAVNTMIADFVRQKSYLKYIETYDLPLGADGQPRPELFVADKLHFSPAGYQLLAERVRPYVTNPAAKADAWPAGKPTAPAVLPGNGLAQHDFFYAGEAKTRDMYVVRQGQVVWAYNEATNRGEISDAVRLANGNILFAHQFGVTLITPEKQVLWNYDAPPKCEIHTAQPIGTNHVIFIQNGPEPKLFVANLASGQMEKEFSLPVKNTNSTHGQFRHARLTEAGTYLVAHMDLGKVVEYDETGAAVWSVDAPGVWSAVRLPNGNTLTCGKTVRELNPQGETVWEFTAADVPDYKFNSLQLATRLSNGDTLINNWVNQWNGKVDPDTAPVQALEISPDKKIVWALRSWANPDLGPATTIQLLDEPAASENVHFGSIR